MSLSLRILAVLPQTQCTRCGYPDCEAYANAIESQEAGINQCPPGGEEGIQRLSALTGLPALPLNPENGFEGPRHIAWIDEQWCIGCTLCISACPTDAILGASKQMHTVIENACTGCELCLPVCPVCLPDCPCSGLHMHLPFIYHDACLHCTLSLRWPQGTVSSTQPQPQYSVVP